MYPHLAVPKTQQLIASYLVLTDDRGIDGLRSIGRTCHSFPLRSFFQAEMIFSSTNTRPMNPHMSNVAQIQTPYRVVVLPHFDSKLAKVELIISHLKRSLRCHDWLSFFFFFANKKRAVFLLQHSRAASLWYYSKRRCNIRERSAITSERKVGNSCGMAKNPRRLPLLAVLSVARGKTR